MNYSDYTKRQLIEYAESIGLSLTSSLNRAEIIKQIDEYSKDNEIATDSVSDDDVVETINVTYDYVPDAQNVSDEATEHVDDFKPKWIPTYIHNKEYYQPLSADVIHDYHIGRRDSHELQTIEYWVKKNGSLLVMNQNKNVFTRIE